MAIAMDRQIAEGPTEGGVPVEQLDYPYRYDRTHTAAQVRKSFHHLAPAHAPKDPVRIAGRVLALRRHGNLIFMDVEDTSGRMQACLRVDSLGDQFRQISDSLHLGDIVGLHGRVFRTRKGELTVLADDLVILSHCLRRLPDKLHGLQDAGLARTRRYLNLMTDARARECFLLRSRMIMLLREFLWCRGFVECETATLDTAYGGAEASPFTTMCHALDRELYLRISPELALKRLLVGNLERVFEVGKQFRNEGLDARHHPEFTSVEVYQAYADYQDMMALTEQLLGHLAVHLLGGLKVVSSFTGEPVELDLSPPFRRMSVLEGIRQYAGVDLSMAGGDEAHKLAEDLGVPVDSRMTTDELIMAVFEALVEPNLVQPTFVFDYPASLCPLTKRHRSNPRLAERFELYVGCLEFANAYSELNDPVEQRRHFEVQAEKRAAGESLAHLPDWDFVEALEYGMPPAGGLGIGLDRLAMLFTGATHIQDVILFPLHGR